MTTQTFPRQTNLLALYLLFVLVLLLIRAIQIGSALHKLHKLQKHETDITTPSQTLSRYCSFKAQSLTRFTTLTFLLSLLNFTWSTANILLDVRTAKVTIVAHVLARIGDALVPLLSGLIVCAALFSTAMLAESALRRRQTIRG